MTVGAGVCGGNSYLVGIPASGTSDYTSTEADHIANWYQVYDGLSKVLLVAPASITYNCFSYAMSPALDWIQDYELLDCILNSTYTEVNKIEDADIVLHFERHGDLIHASKTIVFAHWWSIPIYGCQGKYGAVGVYKSGAFFPAQFYGLDLDGDKFFTTNP
jgi:hypothetical protein